MPDATIPQFWWIILIIAVVVLLVVAVLLIAIWRAAERIDRHALEVWQAGKGIASNTTSIPLLAQTNQTAGRILAAVVAIAAATAALDDKLAAQRPGPS